MPLIQRTITTPQADVSILENDGPGMAVLFVHGNSSCKEVFLRQVEDPAFAAYRMIALDLPGHGASSNAREEAVYSIPGYAAAATHVLRALHVRDAVIFGWSLGGHIAIEMLGGHPGIRGLMIVGAPPFAPGPLGMIRAFQAQRGLLLATKGRFSARDVRTFARICVGSQAAPAFLDAIARTDPAARTHLLRSMLVGLGKDQKRTVENADVPIAVVNGIHEPFARLDYLSGLAWGDLWQDRCHAIADAGHAPFLEKPEEFNALLEAFLRDTALSGHRPAAAGRRRAAG
jgi:pimeloyl-ACP methyl ester carboxylesterase